MCALESQLVATPTSKSDLSFSRFRIVIKSHFFHLLDYIPFWYQVVGCGLIRHSVPLGLIKEGSREMEQMTYQLYSCAKY